MTLNQKGFAIFSIILTLLSAGIVALAGWSVYSNSSNDAAQEQINAGTDTAGIDHQELIQQRQEEQTIQQNNDECEPGVVIVYFKPNVTKQRQLEIIKAESAEVIREYDQFNGYSLKTGTGYKKSLVNVLASYSEVDSVNKEPCPDSFDAPDGVN